MTSLLYIIYLKKAPHSNLKNVSIIYSIKTGDINTIDIFN